MITSMPISGRDFLEKEDIKSYKQEYFLYNVELTKSGKRKVYDYLSPKLAHYWKEEKFDEFEAFYFPESYERDCKMLYIRPNGIFNLYILSDDLISEDDAEEILEEKGGNLKLFELTKKYLTDALVYEKTDIIFILNFKPLGF